MRRKIDKNNMTIGFRKLQEYSCGKVNSTLASGMESDFHIDVEQTILRHDSIGIIISLLDDVIIEKFGIHVVAVAGESINGALLASNLSLFSGRYDVSESFHAVIVRRETRDNGARYRVERPQEVVPDGASVVLVEDVLTTGGSALRAVQALEEDGLKVLGVVALVDRCEGARELFRGTSCELVSLYSREDFVYG